MHHFKTDLFSMVSSAVETNKRSRRQPTEVVISWSMALRHVVSQNIPRFPIS